MTRSAVASLIILWRMPVSLAQTLPCMVHGVSKISDCPVTGCAVEYTADADANRVKNGPLTAGGTPKRLNLDDFERLQSMIKSPQGLAVKDRRIFHGTIGKVTFKEGDLVDVL